MWLEMPLDMEEEMNWKSLFVYKAPDMAIGAFVSLLFIFVVNLLPQFGLDHVDKFGFIMGLALAIFFTGGAYKLRRGGYINLASLTFVSGLMMAFFAIILTSATTMAASALDDFAAPLVAAIASYFSEVVVEQDN